MEKKTDGMEEETDGMERKTDEIKEETNEERLAIVGVEYEMETTFAILNTSFSNGIVAPRRSLRGDSRLKWICRSSYPLHLGSKSIQVYVFGKKVKR